MAIMLGNLTVDEIEERAGVRFSPELKELLEATHQQAADNIQDGKWHCFDIPFVLLCGGMPLAQSIYDHVKNDADKFKTTLQIALA
jgi:hypothetical protein